MEHHIVAETTGTTGTTETTETTAPRGRGLPDGSGLKEWHMVRGDAGTTMCGREVEPSARQLPPEEWGTDEAQPFCHTCGALFLREVP